MEIRPATVDDVPAVLPMVRKIAQMHQDMDPAKYTFHSDPGELYRDWLAARARDPRSVFIVAEADGPPPMLVGFLVGTIEAEIPIYQVKEFGFIHDLWVEEPYRHEGIGRQLVTLAVERFGALGMSQVRGDTGWPNQPARDLLTRCGFRPTAVEMMMVTANQTAE